MALAENCTLTDLAIGLSDGGIKDESYKAFINNNTLRKLEIRAYINDETRKLIEAKIARNVELQKMWMKYGLLIGGITALLENPIKFSLIPILPTILEMADLPIKNHKVFTQSCNHLINTSFFKDRTRVLKRLSCQGDLLAGNMLTSVYIKP